MRNSNIAVLEDVLQWLEQGDKVFFATIVSTWGASPRPPGSVFAYNALRKIQTGSLSGGCIEEALIEELDSFAQDQSPKVHFPLVKVYGASAAEVEKFNLPCGGVLKVVIESLTQDWCVEHFRTLLQSLYQRERVHRRLDFSSGKVTLRKKGDIIAKHILFSEDYFVHDLSPSFRVLLVGAGEVSRCLADILPSLEFDVALCDSRVSFLEKHQADDWGVPVHHCLPDDLVEKEYFDEYSAVLALAHDPRVDDMALLVALTTNAFYVGAMGSINTTTNRKNRLSGLGLKESSVNKLHAPIGVQIGSKTPPEIAISIAAEIIDKRNKMLGCDRKTTSS